MFRYYSAQNHGLPPYCNLQMALLSDFTPQFHSLGWFAHMVLLGIRTALKTGLGCSLAELVYGTTLRIPDEFFVTDQITQINLVEFVSQLKAAMSNLKAVPTHGDSSYHKVHVSYHLSTCTHVFVRHNAIRKLLQVPYDGPYKVLKRSDKHFTLDINGQQKVISLNRLKPAHLDSCDYPTTPLHTQPLPSSPIPQPSSTSSPPVRVTRSGHHVH